jgi:lipopolysaccharide export system permease protein
VKKLNLFVLKSFIGPFIATFFVALFVLLMQFLWRYIDDLVGKGLGFDIIGQILFLASASMVPMALPLAVLLSSLMTFGNLGEHNELVAMKAAGISLMRIMRPLMYFAIIITIVAFLFSNYVLPVANLKQKSLLHDIKNQPAEVMIPEGTFYNGINGFSIRVKKKNQETKMMYNILIYDHREKRGNHSVTQADSGTLVFTENREYLLLTLFNGTSYDEKKPQRGKRAHNYPMERYIFDKETIVFDLTGLDMKRSDEDLFKNHYQMLSVDQLRYTIDSLKSNNNERRLKFNNNIVTRNYFKKLRSNQDSTFKENFSEYTAKDIDSLFITLSKRTQSVVMSSALSYARSAQNQVAGANTTMKNKQTWLNKHKIAWHKKFTFSIACLLLFFVGAPLGAIIRKGGMGLPTVISILLFILYYIISITGEKSGKEGLGDPWFGMWLATLIFIPVGVYLTRKASLDKVAFDIDRFLSPFKKAINRYMAVKRYRKIKDSKISV